MPAGRQNAKDATTFGTGMTLSHSQPMVHGNHLEKINKYSFYGRADEAARPVSSSSPMDASIIISPVLRERRGTYLF